MKTILLSGLVGFLSAVFTSILSHWFVLHRLRKEAKQRIREDYFQKQLTAYMKLWSLLGSTSKYATKKTIISKNETGSYLDIENACSFCQAITDFFFSEDGIFLTRDMRKAVFTARNVLEDYINMASQEEKKCIQISSSKADSIQSKFSRIYNQARYDIAVQDLKFNKKEFGLD